MRKDLENWLRGAADKSAETAEQRVEPILNAVGGADEAELQPADSVSRDEPAEHEQEAGADAGFGEDAPQEPQDDDDTEDGVPEETELAAEKFSVEELPGDELETDKLTAAPDSEPEENRYENNTKRPAWELPEETGSRLSVRMRHMKDSQRVGQIYERNVPRRNLRRFFTICAVAVILIGTVTAMFRSSRRNAYDALTEKAAGLYGQEQYAAAFDVYNDASQRYPDRPEPLLGAAHAAERMGRVDEAIAAYRSSLERFPSDAAHARSGVFYELGRLHAMLKAWDKAQENFEEAVASDAANYSAYYSLGDALEEQGILSEALSAYNQALELSPSSDAAAAAAERVSEALAAKGEDEKTALAEQKYKYALTSGDVALKAGQYREASDFFAGALAIRSDDAVAWVGFAEARGKLGDAAGEVKSLERALERDPEHRRAKSRLAEIEAQSKNNSAPPRRNSGSSPRSSVPQSVPEVKELQAEGGGNGRGNLFTAGVELYRNGDYEASFNSFMACLRSAEMGRLPSASLAGMPGPVWRGPLAKLSASHEAGLLADAVRQNPADRELYVNIFMAGSQTGMDRQNLRSAMNEACSHATERGNK